MVKGRLWWAQGEPTDLEKLVKSFKLNNMSMGQYKKNVTPLLTHWSYVLIALTHQCVSWIVLAQVIMLSSNVSIMILNTVILHERQRCCCKYIITCKLYILCPVYQFHQVANIIFAITWKLKFIDISLPQFSTAPCSSILHVGYGHKIWMGWCDLSQISIKLTPILYTCRETWDLMLECLTCLVCYGGRE